MPSLTTFSPELPNNIPAVLVPMNPVWSSIQKPTIPLVHQLLVLIPKAVAWLRCYHALQERVPKRWALSCHYLTNPFECKHFEGEQNLSAATLESSLHRYPFPKILPLARQVFGDYSQLRICCNKHHLLPQLVFSDPYPQIIDPEPNIQKKWCGGHTQWLSFSAKVDLADFWV